MATSSDELQYSQFIARLTANLEATKSLAGYPIGDDNLPGFGTTINKNNITVALAEVLENEKHDRTVLPDTGGAKKVPRKRNKKDHLGYTIARDDVGEYYLLLEPKSKTLFGRRIIKWPQGSFKTIKMVVRIDTKVPELFVSATTYIPINTPETEAQTKVAEDEIKLQIKAHKTALAKTNIKDSVLHLIRGAQNLPIIKHKVNIDDKMHSVLCKRVVTFSRFKEKTLEYFVDNEVGVSSKQQLEFKRGLMHQVLNTLSGLHADHIAHADVKPQNFLYDPKEKTVSLTDFGFATQDPREESRIISPRYASRKAYENQFSQRDSMSIDDVDKSPQLKNIFDTSIAFHMLRESQSKTYSNTVVSESVLQGEVWSALILWYDLLYGRDVSGKEMTENMGDDFFKKMFANTPETMDELIIEFNKYYADDQLDKIYTETFDKPITKETTAGVISEENIEFLTRLHNLTQYADEIYAGANADSSKILALANILVPVQPKETDDPNYTLYNFNTEYINKYFNQDVAKLSSMPADYKDLSKLLSSMKVKLDKLDKLHIEKDDINSSLICEHNKIFYNAIAFLCCRRLAEISEVSEQSQNAKLAKSSSRRWSFAALRNSISRYENKEDYKNQMHEHQAKIIASANEFNLTSFISRYSYTRNN